MHLRGIYEGLPLSKGGAGNGLRKWMKWFDEKWVCHFWVKRQTFHEKRLTVQQELPNHHRYSIGQLQLQGVMSLVMLRLPYFSKAAILSWRKWCLECPVDCLLVARLVVWINRAYWSNHIVNHMIHFISSICLIHLASMSCRAFLSKQPEVPWPMKDEPNTGIWGTIKFSKKACHAGHWRSQLFWAQQKSILSSAQPVDWSELKSMFLLPPPFRRSDKENPPPANVGTTSEKLTQLPSTSRNNCYTKVPLHPNFPAQLRSLHYGVLNVYTVYIYMYIYIIVYIYTRTDIWREREPMRKSTCNIIPTTLRQGPIFIFHAST